MFEFNLMILKRIFGFNMTKKESFLSRGNRKIYKEIDIIHILQKIQEIKSIKKLILSSDQLLSFKIREKPPLRILPESVRLSQKKLIKPTLTEINGNLFNVNTKILDKVMEEDSSSFERKNKFNIKKTFLQYS